MNQPETLFASVGSDRVAYQVFGDGPRDLLYTFGLWSHLDIQWEEPAAARFLRRLGSFSRVIRFDRRGTGVSDRASDTTASPVDLWLEDCKTVLDAVRSASAILLGQSTPDSGSLVLEFASRFPERCSGLIFANATVCWAERPGYPEGHPAASIQLQKEFVLQHWGRDAASALMAPSQRTNPVYMSWQSKFQRSMASPRMVAENIDLLARTDSRPLLESVRAPTLVFGRRENQLIPAAQSACIAKHIRGAQYVEMPGADPLLAWEGADQYLDHIEEFVTGSRRGEEPDRALATILFTDIVGSTERAMSLGDRAWRALLDQHDEILRRQVGLFGGAVADHAGDGSLSTFANPRQAVECALALGDALADLQIEIRAGVHFGEVERRADGRVGGIAVHVGARVMAMAQAGQVLVSRTARDILMGSRYTFEDRGMHELKGVPGRWAIYAVGQGAPG